MPELGFAVLCEYARIDGGVMHIMAAGINTIEVGETPVGVNLAVAVDVRFSNNECGSSPHQLQVIIQDADGDRLGQAGMSTTPTWPEGLPIHFTMGAPVVLRFGVVLAQPGIYSVDVLLNNESETTIPFRVLLRQTGSPDDD